MCLRDHGKVETMALDYGKYNVANSYMKQTWTQSVNSD